MAILVTTCVHPRSTSVIPHHVTLQLIAETLLAITIVNVPPEHTTKTAHRFVFLGSHVTRVVQIHVSTGVCVFVLNKTLPRTGASLAPRMISTVDHTVN